MNTYPADERQLWEVERGRSCGTVVPLPPGESLEVGDSILFALAHSEPGQEPSFVKDGDSVRVLLTGVTGLGEADPVTGQALFHLAWAPLGQGGPLVTAKRTVKARSPRPKG